MTYVKCLNLSSKSIRATTDVLKVSLRTKLVIMKERTLGYNVKGRPWLIYHYQLSGLHPHQWHSTAPTAGTTATPYNAIYRLELQRPSTMSTIEVMIQLTTPTGHARFCSYLQRSKPQPPIAIVSCGVEIKKRRCRRFMQGVSFH